MNLDLEALVRLLIRKGVFASKEWKEIKEEIIKEEQEERDNYSPYW